ncbi:hypothetical protein SNE40_000194 [Patella caerulea]
MSTISVIFTFRYFHNQIEINGDNDLIQHDTVNIPKRSSRKYDIKQDHELIKHVMARIPHRNPERSSRKYDVNDAYDLQKLFDDFNTDQYIRNSNYNLDLSDSGVVILVQVHDREKELKMLVDSLKNVQDIEKSLVVFSHDIFLPTINNIIDSIDFCSVMQIYFPYAQQIMKITFQQIQRVTVHAT